MNQTERAVMLLFECLTAEREGDQAGLTAAQFEFISISRNQPGFGAAFTSLAVREFLCRAPVGTTEEQAEGALRRILTRLFPDDRVAELTPRGRA
jgi:hypothetical protein